MAKHTNTVACAKQPAYKQHLRAAPFAEPECVGAWSDIILAL